LKFCREISHINYLFVHMSAEFYYL